jgi:hypothetical protein
VCCPYGQPSDRLWIKEEHYLFGAWQIDGRRKDGKFKLRFEADRSMGVLFDQEPNGLITGRHTGAPGWYRRIGMFMPRWASRDMDEIVSVRVERLQEISEADAMAEGVKPIVSGTWWQGYRECCEQLIQSQFQGDEPPDWMVEPKLMAQTPHLDRSAKLMYQLLWDQINGAGSWDANPWVWVIEFRRVTNG